MWIALRGLRGFWDLTFGAIFLGIASVRVGGSFFGGAHPFGFLKDANDAVVNTLEALASGTEAGVGYFIHQAARLQLWIGQEVVSLAQDTLHFGEWLVKTYIPTAVHYAGTIAFPWPAIGRAIDHEIERYLPKVSRRIHDLSFKDGLRAAELATLWAAFGALAGTIALPGHGISLPKGIGIPKEWRKWRTRVERRLAKVEGIAAAAVLAGLMANVLGVSARCLRSGNVGKVARRLCGLDSLLLNSVLGGLIIFDGPFSVVDLAEELLAVFPPLLDGMGLIVAELEGL